jgi:hypothetical protein
LKRKKEKKTKTNNKIIMDHNISKLLGKPTLEGQVGESHVWDGPLDTSGFPMGKGSSSGITGMHVKKYPCKSYSLQGPITQRAKGF